MTQSEPLRWVLTRSLTGEGAFEHPEHILSGLTAAQAVAEPPGLSSSVAQCVGHMVYWMRLYLSWIARGRAGEAPPCWPRPTIAEWPGVQADFTALLAAARELAHDADALARPVLFDDGPVPVATLLGDLGAHNAYHCGQVVLIRRLLGLWPPAG